MADFLDHDIAPTHREAGIPPVEVVTDGSPSSPAARSPRLRQARHPLAQAAPRSPNLNAFVERFQGSVLYLPYRTAFRYHTSAAHIDEDPQAWLRHYNFERPHRGYRTRGRIPATLFYAARPDLLTAKGWDPDDINPAA